LPLPILGTQFGVVQCYRDVVIHRNLDKAPLVAKPLALNYGAAPPLCSLLTQ